MINYRNTTIPGTDNLRRYVTGSIISGDAITGELDRITKYFLYMNYYKGLHWRINNYTMARFNYIRAFVDKVIQFLVGKDSFSLQVQAFATETVEKELEKAAEKYLLYHWNKNNRKLLTHKMLQMGGVCGDVWVFVGWDVEKKTGKISVLDSRYCFPEFKDGDWNNLEKFTVRQPLATNSESFTVRVTQYTKDSVSTWYQKTTSVDSKEKQREEVYPNPLGFIPIVHIQNRPTSDGYFSSSDVEDIIGLNKMYNELSQELKGIIDYYVAPTTVVTGATLGNVKKKLGTVWSGLPPEANVFNLGLDVDLSASQNFMQMLKTAMHELSDVPENFLGKVQPISNTSAAALQLTYQPIIQQADLKWLTYGTGIVEINNMLIKLGRIYDPNNSDLKTMDSYSRTGLFEDDFTAEPIFPYGFPNDKMNDMQLADYELRLRLNSRRRILERMGTHNIPELMDEIEEDTRWNAKLDGDVATLSAGEPNETSQEAPQENKEGEATTDNAPAIEAPSISAEDVLNSGNSPEEEKEFDPNNPPKQTE